MSKALKRVAVASLLIASMLSTIFLASIPVNATEPEETTVQETLADEQENVMTDESTAETEATKESTITGEIVGSEATIFSGIVDENNSLLPQEESTENTPESDVDAGVIAVMDSPPYPWFTELIKTATPITLGALIDIPAGSGSISYSFVANEDMEIVVRTNQTGTIIWDKNQNEAENSGYFYFDPDISALSEKSVKLTKGTTYYAVIYFGANAGTFSFRLPGTEAPVDPLEATRRAEFEEKQKQHMIWFENAIQQAEYLPFRTLIEIPPNSGEKTYVVTAGWSYMITREIPENVNDSLQYNIYDSNGKIVYWTGGGTDNISENSGIFAAIPGEQYYAIFEDSTSLRKFAIEPNSWESNRSQPYNVGTRAGAVFSQKESNTSLVIAGDANTSWDVWTLEFEHDFDNNVNNSGGVWWNHEYVLSANYSAYFRNYKIENNWNGKEVDVINNTEPSDEAKNVLLGENEKLSWFQQFSVASAPVGMVGGSLKVSVDIYVPVGSELYIDDQGVIRDRRNPTPTPTPSQTEVTLKTPIDTTIEVVGTFANDATLVVTKIEDGHFYSETVKNALLTAHNKLVAYDITILNSRNEKIQPSGMAKVTLPLLEGYDLSRISLYKVLDDGTLIPYTYTIDETAGTLVFETDSFSIFAIAESKASTESQTNETSATNVTKPVTTTSTSNSVPKTGESSSIGVYTMAIVLSAMAIATTGLILRKKKISEK